MTTAVTELIAFTIDCSDAGKLARFYAELTGGEVTGEYPEYGYAAIAVGPYAINFQGVKNYTAPQWPNQDQPQQYHLDFRVTDLPVAIDHATGLGAVVARDQPGGDSYRVLLDPDGHPFCLCLPKH
jgi:predicted enzyme related to lactoylglutathione lyase